MKYLKTYETFEFGGGAFNRSAHGISVVNLSHKLDLQLRDIIKDRLVDLDHMGYKIRVRLNVNNTLSIFINKNSQGYSFKFIEMKEDILAMIDDLKDHKMYLIGWGIYLKWTSFSRATDGYNIEQLIKLQSEEVTWVEFEFKFENMN